MRYEIWWDGEVIDTADTYDEAEFLMREYCLAFQRLDVSVVDTNEEE